jgi:hypothetical protein
VRYVESARKWAEKVKNEQMSGETRGRAVDAERSEGVTVDPVRVEVAGWVVEVGRLGCDEPGWGVVLWRAGHYSLYRVVRIYPDRFGALAFAVALIPWLDSSVNRPSGGYRWPSAADLATLEDVASPIVRTDATSGGLVHGLVLGRSDEHAEIVDRLGLAMYFGRAFDGFTCQPLGCALEEDACDRLALRLSGAWLGSRDVECVREGLAVLARGERLDGFRWESWIVSVARLAGIRGAEVSK